MLAALLVVAACYPDLDWRELRPPDAGFVAMLPGRIVEESRPLPAGPVLRQWSSRARQSLFAVGYADLPGPAPLDGLRDTLVANIQGQVESERGIAVDGVAGREIVAAGRLAGGPVMLRLRLYARGPRVYQVTLLGRPGDLSSDEVDSFFGAFRLRDRPQP